MKITLTNYRIVLKAENFKEITGLNQLIDNKHFRRIKYELYEDGKGIDAIYVIYKQSSYKEVISKICGHLGENIFKNYQFQIEIWGLPKKSNKKLNYAS